MAHATIASLTRTMESLLMSNSPMNSLICDHREEFRTLHEKVSSLEVFLKNIEKNNNSGKMTDLEAEIKEVGNVVEHIVQLRVTEVVMENDEILRGKAHEKLSDSLRQLGEDIDRVRKESTKIQDKGKQVSKDSLVQDFSSSTKDILNVKNNMVGRDEQRKRLLEDLTRDYSGKPKVIPIIGMGGIGKTTLAREVYNDACIRSHFDVCAWVTVSQQYNKKEILMSLLRSTKGDTCNMDDEAEIADMLQKSLKGKRYLVVMDDIWSSEVWDYVRLCFPSEGNNAGSRILLTTRNNEVACYAGTENRSLQMDLMDEDESWKLFKSAASENEALPSEFEAIGRRIAEKCHGVPLTIVVVAGLVRSKRTIEDWESVANDVKSFVANDPDEQCLHVLGLSYSHLTSDLKACLLYFGIFSEDSEIPAKRLLGFWMAEGFLNLEKDMEREAEKCLQELVDRCLVLVSEKSLDETKIRSCKVHDLIHDMCLREIQRGNVFLMNDIVFSKSDEKKAKTHDLLFDCEPSESPSLSRHKMQPFKRWTGDEIEDFHYGLYRALLVPGHHQLTDGNNNNLLKRTRSLFFSGFYRSTFILKSELIHFKLLKVLDLSEIGINRFPLQILSLIWLRYLSFRIYEELEIPPEICRLWNLQTFIVQGLFQNATFPEQIWGLMQLSHLQMYEVVLPDIPSISVDNGKNMGFSNIQTVSALSLHCFTKEVIFGIQNVKKLRIKGSYQEESSDGLLNNLVHLHQLETLILNFIDLYSGIPGAKAFPATLKKLKFEGAYNLSWSDLDIIAELPNLEVLKLIYGTFKGEEWDPNVSVFTRLKLLLIYCPSVLKYWKATNDNFPVLERLFIRDCPYLEEMPIEFADIHSLQLIELEKCTPKLAESAERIQQEQEDLGNHPVVVNIKSPRWPSSDDDDDDDGNDDDDDEDDDDDDDDEDEDDDGNEDDDEDDNGRRRILAKELKSTTIKLWGFHASSSVSNYQFQVMHVWRRPKEIN